VYSTCIFCHAPLGRNEAIEAFPVGRRLAFDAAKGRLWVVCSACARWNLTPLESRWEAVEECERLFRDSRLRASTGEIGLARIAEGTTLVRVGNPLRPEMAAWRYGSRFQSRRLKYIAVGAATALGIGGVMVAGPLTGAISWAGALNVFNYWNILGGERVHAKVPFEGRILRLDRLMLQSVLVRPNMGAGFSLEVPHKRFGTIRDRFKSWKTDHAGPRVTLVGDEAVRAARHLLPRINRSGGSAGAVQDAVGVLDQSRSVDDMFSNAARTPRESFPFWKRPPWAWNAFKNPFVHLASLSVPVRLALEMAVHENDERRAMEGELAALEERWREAEEIAAIADDLFLPKTVRDSMERLKG
jgi:hypothetical protein